MITVPQNAPLRRAILTTLAYFDVFEFPLTSFEVWKWLWFPKAGEAVSLRSVLEALDELVEQHTLENRDGFYVFPGRIDLVEQRLKRSVIAEGKFRKARAMARWLRLFPFVRAICVCNSLAYANARPESDIDFFVLVQGGRIWAARFFTTAFLKLLGVRPTPRETRNRFCLSFYLRADAASIETLKLAEEDPYLTYWVTQLVPIYDEGVFEKFWEANAWCRKLLPNAFPTLPAPRRTLPRAGAWKRLLEAAFSIVPDHLFRSLQWRLLPAHLRELANRDSRVVLSDTVLKFHDNDRRQFFRDQFLGRLANV